tara:strand:+ start:288 stop:950 length:663 start_codon:yes stop_codon:yes gene_type:complete
MSQMRLPKVTNPLADIQNLAIIKDIKPTENIKMEMETIVNVVPEEPVSSKDVFGVKKDKPEYAEEPVKVEEVTGQGKRGKDKKKRKKKVMSEKQLAALAAGRIKSLEKRRAKSKKAAAPTPEPVPEIEKPVKAEKLDYNTFSNYMNMYEETKKKKNYSKNSEPHPNKVINERHRPQPPQSAPRIIPKPKPAPSMMRWNGNISAFTSHKKTSKSNRWNYGI